MSEQEKAMNEDIQTEDDIETTAEEAVENSGQEIADTEKRKAETSIEAVPAEN